MARIFSGGCLCGAVQFRVEGDPVWPHYCACNMCQKWSGAPIVAWVDLPLKGLTWTKGEPKLFRTTPKTQRGFCASCGGSLFALDDGSDMICMTIASIDQKNRLKPESQSYKSSAPKWLAVEIKGK